MSAIPAPGSFHFPRHRSQSGSTVRPAARTWADVFGRIVAHAALFVAVTLVTYGVSGMAGNVMLERARKAGGDAQGRLLEATRREASVRLRLETIANPRAVEEWALEHDFASPERVASLVAPPISQVRASTRSSSGATESAVSSFSPEAVALHQTSGVDEDGPSFR